MAISPDAQSVINQAGPGALEYIQGKGYPGQRLTSGEAQRALVGFSPQATQQTTPATQGAVPTLGGLAGQQFKFDPNQYLPGIQQQAGSIYDPQRAQIEALSKLGQAQTEQAKITTKEDFAKEMQRTIEAINQRGAFFGGGAIQQQGGVSQRETGALTNINLQNQAAQAGFLAQQAGLSAEQAKYIQDQLSGAQGSAYSKFQDERGFQTDLYKLQQQEQQQALENQRHEQEMAMKRQQLEADLKAAGLSAKAAASKAKTESDRWAKEYALKVQTANKPSGTSSSTGSWTVHKDTLGNPLYKSNSKTGEIVYY